MEDQTIINNVLKTGNSLAVVIPANFVKKVGVKPGDKVKISTKPHHGEITYTFLNIRQLTLV